MNVLRSLTVRFVFDFKLAKFSCFQKFRFLFRKNPLFFQNTIFWVILLFQSILRQVCYLYPFNKTVQDLFSRNPSTFQKQNKFWTFWETLLFRLLSTAKLLPLAFFKKLQIFSKNLSVFIKKLKFFETFEKTANFSSSYIQNLLQNPFYCFIKANSLNALRDLTLSFAFYTKFNISGHF